MFQKYKQLIVGIIIGGLLFSIPVMAEKVFVTAELSDIKVNVNGQILNLENQPLMYNDRTYLPLREIGSAVGMTVDYDEATDTAILTNSNNPAPDPTVPPMSTYPPYTAKQNAEGFNVYTIEGVEYIPSGQIEDILKSMGYRGYHILGQINVLYDSQNKVDIFTDVQVCPSNTTLVKLEYYNTTIKPWIQSL